LKSLLEEAGLEATEAANGEDALEKAHAHPPDMIVSDILMPVMDGFALCRLCKSDEKLQHIPFVFFTATYTDQKEEKFALSLGADRFIIKPQEPEVLISILKEVWGEGCTAKQAAIKPLGEEMDFFKQYNEILFWKLEKKMLDLEIANRELRISEEKYRLSFENVTDVVYTIDTDLKVLSVSPSIERVLGYSPQEFIGLPASDLGKILAPESLEQAIADISLVLRGETILATVYRFTARDGTVKYGEVSGSPMMHDGKIVGMISIARDITDRKLAEERLKESEKRYRELYDFLPIPVYEMDFEANITSANRAIYETFGGTEEDLKKGFQAWQLLSPEDVERSKRNIERLVKGERVDGTEYNLKRLDGSVFPGILVSSVMFDKRKPSRLRGAIIDISERKRQEDELQRMNAFLDSIVENIPDMVFLKDVRDLRFIRFNRAGEDLLGYSRNDLLGKNDYDFFPKDQADLFTEKDREVLDGKELVDIPEESIQTRNRGMRILHTKKVPILDASGEPTCLLGISEDITERKQAEEELIKTTERLRRSLASTVHAISMAVEVKDPYTAGHQTRTTDLAGAIAKEMGFGEDRADFVRMAARIHDIGKIAIPAEILNKPRKLTDIEFSMIKLHPRCGYDILKDIEFSWPVADVILQHHERLDGSGYPEGLKGEDILLEARILAVADVVEAVASHRPYRPALGIEAALEEIANNRGILYDSEVTDACLRLFNRKDYKIGG
ncbi:MAG: PAS domain S-box protein, partial [Deltaproteobacteria bacterium]|nr:PAS domain S-box protein [Deltaproteobacteria bacterium]